MTAQLDCISAHHTLSSEISRQASISSARNFEQISRLAFYLGFQAKTLAETLLWTMHFDAEKVNSVMNSALAILDRAGENEIRYASNSLDWRDLYFDDLFSLDLVDLSRYVKSDLSRANPSISIDGFAN